MVSMKRRINKIMEYENLKIMEESMSYLEVKDPLIFDYVKRS